jgi:hypothetical protein
MLTAMAAKLTRNTKREAALQSGALPLVSFHRQNIAIFERNN